LLAVEANSPTLTTPGYYMKRTGRYQTMIKIVRYQGKRRITITIDESGNVTVTVEPPQKRRINNLVLFKQRNP